MESKILIIDDAPVYRESLKIVLKSSYSVCVNSFEGNIWKLIDDSEADIVIIGSDRSFYKVIPDFRNILNHLKEKSLILLFPAKDETIIPSSLFKRMRFLPRKADSILSISDVVSNLVEDIKTSQSVSAADEESKDTYELPLDMRPFIKTSSMEHFFQSAKTTLPVFFKAEEGMRGEDVAKMIHYNSPMNGFAFTKLNSGVGDVNGIYSYIKSDLPEKNYICGTLFIEDIDALPQKAQQEIVAMIDGVNNREYSGEDIVNINVRIVASSSCSLKTLLKEKKIINELYYRLSVGDFSIFPLREKPEEIPLIVKELSSLFSSKYSMPVKTFSSPAIALMQKYIWSVNIDELISVVQRSMLFSKSEIIGEDDVLFIPVKRDEISDNGKIDSIPIVDTVDENDTTGDTKDSANVVHSDYSPDIIMNLAHEIKNPLVGIKTFASLLPEKYDDIEFRNDFFKIVNSDVDKIDALIERIMQYENINNGIAEPLFVNEIVNELIEENQNIFNKRNLAVKTELEKEGPKIKCSKDVFKYSLENLTYSLIGYCAQGDIIKFVSRTTGENGTAKKVEIEISLEGESDKRVRKSDELEEISVVLAKKAVGRYDGSVLYLKEYENIFGYLLSMEKSK